MDSQTVERIFGGITYLFSAASKAEFFSNLEVFLHELFGPVSFTFLSAAPTGRRFQVEHSSHPRAPGGKGAPCEARCDLLVDLLRRQEDLPWGSRPAGSPLRVEAEELPVYAVKVLTEGDGRFACAVFHDPPGPEAGCGGVFGAEALAFDHISSAYFRIKDQERIQSSLDLLEAKLAAINQLGELIGNLDLDVLLTKLMELSLFIVSAQVGSVVLCGDGGIESRVEWGVPLDIVRRLRHRDGPSVLDRVLLSGEPELIRDFSDPGRYQGVPDLQVDSYLCIPLLSKGKLLGAINLINSAQESGFTQEDRESILTISGLAATAIENAILHRHSLEKERMSEQLRIAQSIQNRMYPKECPFTPSYEMAWVNLSCDETGGDYFDFIPADDERLAVVIGDASGHGIGAALLMATGRANLRALFSVKRGIREVMLALDALLERDMDEERFMTLFIGMIDQRQHVLTYLNAGHDSPLLFRARDGTVESLLPTGLPLGVLGSGSQHSEPDPLQLGTGDVLLLASDGVWEGTNAARERFGKGRLIDVFSRVAGLPASRIVETIQEEVFAFTRGAERKDDFTLLAVKRIR